MTPFPRTISVVTTNWTKIHCRGQPARMSDPTAQPGRNDAELITATRGGDTAAFGELWDRHVVAANRLARQLTSNPSDADDLVSEAFTKIFTALRDGRGPDEAF